jgi:hypothetical protein
MWIRPICALATVFLAFALGGCAALRDDRPPPPSVPEIVKMAQDKVPAEEIVKRIDEGRANYRLSGADYAKLRDQGVPDAVLNAMHRRQLEAARYEEWLRARDRLFWAPGWAGPYPYPYWGSPFGPRYPYWW